MTMVIAVNNDDFIIMTADKRITYTNLPNREISFKDDYKKIKIIDNQYIICFVGNKNIADWAFHFIEKKKESLANTEPLSFFKEAFIYGRDLFQKKYPNIRVISIFILGYIVQGKPIMFSFSSDEDYEPTERKTVIKLNASNEEEEENLIKTSEQYINSEISRRCGSFNSEEELANVFVAAIKRIDNQKIGKTAYTVILSPLWIKEFNHE